MVSILLIFIILSGSALTNLAFTGFTHPEIGEFIIYGLDNDMPLFTIYGFTQYKVMNPLEPYRNIQVINHKKSLNLEDMLSKLIDNIEDKNTDNSPLVFEYTGILQEFEYQLDALPKKERIKAIRLLAGFNGKKSLPELLEIDGFENIDISYLEEFYNEFSVEIDGDLYPYRVLMFYIEEENWDEAYFERYHFIKKGRDWILLHITKEYASDYLQRNSYIHGLPGMSVLEYEKSVHDALRGSNWLSTQESVAKTEKVPVSNNETIHVQNVEVFRLPTDITYTFQEEWLSSIEYTLHKEQSYYSAIVSLYMRYYDPITMLPNGDMTWYLPDMKIELVYDYQRPILRFSPRIEYKNNSAG